MQFISDMIVPRTDTRENRKELLAISFNQDSLSLNVGHDDGYTLYNIKSFDTLEMVHDSADCRRSCVVERLFSSSLVTFVSISNTRKLAVYHYQKENEICSHGYGSAILSVRMNRKRIVVCLEESIHIHNIRDMRMVHTIKDTPSNPLGLCDLSSNEDSCYLAYPGNANSGHVQIFDAHSLTATCGFAAHDGQLAALKFSPDSTKIATASQKGTVIRVFEIPTGLRLFEFIRGLKRCVTIYSLAFSADSTLLASSSNTETVHVFSLVRPDPSSEIQRQEETQDTVSSWVNYFQAQASSILPSHMNDLMLREKSICTARLPMSGTKSVVGIPKLGNTNYLAVATADGYLFFYTIESEGRECVLKRQFRIGPTYGNELPGESIALDATTVRLGSNRARNRQLYPHTRVLSDSPSEGSEPTKNVPSSTVTTTGPISQRSSVDHDNTSRPCSRNSSKRSSVSGSPELSRSSTQQSLSFTHPLAEPPATQDNASFGESKLEDIRGGDKSEDEPSDDERDLQPPKSLINDLDEFPPLQNIE